MDAERSGASVTDALGGATGALNSKQNLAVLLTLAVPHK